MEDAMIINKSSMERGLCHGTMFKTETIDLKPLRARGDAITTEFRRGSKKARPAAPGKSGDPIEKFIDVDGLPHVGQVSAFLRRTGGARCCANSVSTGSFVNQTQPEAGREERSRYQEHSQLDAVIQEHLPTRMLLRFAVPTGSRL